MQIGYAGTRGMSLEMVESPRSMTAFVHCGRIVLLCTLAALMSGCDRCGDWVPPIKFQAQVCRDEAPSPK
jgi:hypothetical protein